LCSTGVKLMFEASDAERFSEERRLFSHSMSFIGMGVAAVAFAILLPYTIL
jgi:hypothetical protein